MRLSRSIDALTVAIGSKGSGPTRDARGRFVSPGTPGTVAPGTPFPAFGTSGPVGTPAPPPRRCKKCATCTMLLPMGKRRAKCLQPEAADDEEPEKKKRRTEVDKEVVRERKDGDKPDGPDGSLGPLAYF